MAGELPRTPFDAASLNEFEERLEAAIAQLPPTYRETILLVCVEQLRPVDAAAVCGISAELLRQRLKRAREFISRVITDQDSPTETGRKELSHVSDDDPVFEALGKSAADCSRLPNGNPASGSAVTLQSPDAPHCGGGRGENYRTQF